MAARECAHISINWHPSQNNIYRGREDRNKAKHSALIIASRPPSLLSLSSRVTKESESIWNSFWWNHRVRWLLQTLGVWSIFYAHMYMYFSRVLTQWTVQLVVLPSRFVLRRWWYVVSWNQGVLFASHPVQLSLDISQTRLLPLGKNRRQSPKVISCSFCADSVFMASKQMDGFWMLVQPHAEDWWLTVSNMQN